MARLTKVDPPLKEKSPPTYTVRTVTIIDDDTNIPTAYASIKDVLDLLVGEKFIAHNQEVFSEFYALIDDTHRRDTPLT